MKKSLGSALTPALDEEFTSKGTSSGDISGKRCVKSSAVEENSNAVTSGGGADLSNSLDEKLLAMLGKDDDKKAWRSRMDAASKIASIVENAGCPLEINSALMDTLTALGKRMETSSAMAMKSAVAIGLIGERLAPGSVPAVARTCIKSLIATFADNKKAVAAAAIKALRLFVTHGEEDGPVDASDYSSLLNYFPRALSSPHAESCCFAIVDR